MRNSRMIFAIGAMLVATFVVGGATPASADPTGFGFGWTATNFKGDTTGTDAGIVGTPLVTSSGVTVDSGVSVSPAVPALFLTGGLDYVEFSITTDDSGFLAGTTSADSLWLIDGLNNGPSASVPPVATGLIFISFSADGAYLPLDGTAFGLPVIPNPGTLAGVAGAPAIPISIAGDPVDLIPWDTADLAGTTMAGILVALGMSIPTALSVDGMTVGFEIFQPIPEPTSMLLLGTGLVSMLGVRRRRKR